MKSFATILSPLSGELRLGPLTINAYGLTVAAGVLAALSLATLTRTTWSIAGSAPRRAVDARRRAVSCSTRDRVVMDFAAIV